MKRFRILLTLFFFISIQSYSQTDTVARYYADRYVLDLPEEWKKPKLIEAITEILPQTFDEYIDSNRQFCMDCNAPLIVVLLITPAKQVKGEETYQFSAALGLFDTSGKELIELSLISPTEKHKIKVTLNYKNQTSNNSGAYENNRVRTDYNVTRNIVTGPSGRIVGSVRTVSQQPNTPVAPRITNNIPVAGKKSPSIYDLMLIAEARVYEIREILENLKKETKPIQD
jgi:hypothetical protein